MARKSNTRSAAGQGSIRQRPDGRWEGRFVYIDELGQKKRGSVYADTQKECRQKITAAAAAADIGDYRQPKKYTLEQWLEEWLCVYCTDLKPLTVAGYKSKIHSRIIPNIGKVPLTALNNVQIQRFYNALYNGTKTATPLSAKSIQNIHGILHKALKQAVIAGIIRVNPADGVKLPQVKKPDLKPLMDEDITKFLNAIKGDFYESLYFVALFSGMRESELIGLRWSDIDLENGTITVQRQIQKDYNGTGYITIDETKNGKQRTIVVAPSVVKVLKAQKIKQLEWHLQAGQLWNNEYDNVFTDTFGGHLKHKTIYDRFKKIVKSIGMKETRFHDLRHSYAVNALQAGDNIKSIQEQLGHYSSAFTMDTYAAVSNTMRKETQDKMELLIKSVSNL